MPGAEALRGPQEEVIEAARLVVLEPDGAHAAIDRVDDGARGPFDPEAPDAGLEAVGADPVLDQGRGDEDAQRFEVPDERVGDDPRAQVAAAGAEGAEALAVAPADRNPPARG